MKKIILIFAILSMLCSYATITQADQLNEGIYNLICVDSGRYLNVYAGNDWDGVNVCVWEKDGSPEQKFKMVDKGGNKYVLYPTSSNGRVLDANRGNSYSNPLQAGCNIDIWQTNDAPAQEWYIDDRGGGKYTIELVAARGLVVTCDNPTINNGNCSLQKYTGATNQLWYLQRTDGGTVKPTPIPTATPAPVITPIPTVTAAPIATPIPTTAPTPTPIPETTRIGYVYNTGGVVLRVRAAANTNCEILGTVAEGSAVSVRGSDKTNGFWKVDYNGRTGYCHGDYITFTKPAANTLDSKIGQRLANFNSMAYNGSSPFMWGCDYSGQCTWYCWGRAFEKTGIKLNTVNNANTWLSRLNTAGTRAVWDSSAPRKDSIAVKTSGTWGHVMYIEDIIGDSVYYTEANVPMNHTVDSGDGVLKKTSKYNMSKMCNGYIYLN